MSAPSSAAGSGAVDFVHSRRSSLISASERSSPRSHLSIHPSVSSMAAAERDQHLTIKVGYKHTRPGEAAHGEGAVMKEVTLRVTPQHTAARAIDKIVKALRERYPQHHNAVGREYALVARGVKESRVPHACGTPLRSLGVVTEHAASLLMLHMDDPELRGYTECEGAAGSRASSRRSEHPSAAARDFEADSGDERAAAAPLQDKTPVHQPSAPPSRAPSRPASAVSLPIGVRGTDSASVPDAPRDMLRSATRPRRAEAAAQAVCRTADVGLAAKPRVDECGVQTQPGETAGRAQRREMFRVEAVELATELRVQRQRQRAVEPVALCADRHLEATLGLAPGYPKPSGFAAGGSFDAAPFESLTSAFGQMHDPMLLRLAAAVDEERLNAQATIKALHDEVHDLRHGWLVEASKVEQLKECVAASAADRIALQNAMALSGRADCEHIARIVRKKLDGATDSLLLELDLLRDRAAFYKRKAEPYGHASQLGVHGYLDAVPGRGTPTAPRDDVPTIPDAYSPGEDERSGHSTAAPMSRHTGDLGLAPSFVDALSSLRAEPAAPRAAQSPKMDEARVDAFLLDKIRDLESENDALAHRLTLMETRSAVLAGGREGEPDTWLDSGDEARLLAERVVHLEGELARERDLRAQYAMRGEVLKQVGINEILRQKEQLAVQRTMLANVGVDVENAGSPLRTFTDAAQQAAPAHSQQ